MGDAPNRFQLVLTTTDSEALAEMLAHELVERGLAACVNIVGPVRSVYRWDGEVVRGEERLLLIKTSVDHFQKVDSVIRELHTYDVPELLAISVADGNERYLGWLASCLGES